MAPQFTASDLNGPGHLFPKNVYKSTICEIHLLEQYSEPVLEEIHVFQA